MNVNITLEIRLKKYPRGYVLEYKSYKKNIFGFYRPYWTHLVYTSGIEEMPYYYKNNIIAIEDLCKMLKKEFKL